MSDNETKPRSRAIYLLPNLFTTAALFCGFFAVVSGMHGRFEAAAIAIFVAMVLDGLDGRVARLFHGESEFGAQYDSMSDVVAFGVAPALVSLSWALSTLGKAGWMAAFIFLAGTALRLARFNAQIGKVDKKYFIGLASPPAAAVVAGMIWVCAEEQVNPESVAVLGAIVVALTGLLMVSNFRYNSFKDIDLKGKVPFVGLLAIVFVFAVVFIDPARVLFAAALLYALSGPVGYVLRKRRHA